MKFFFTLAILFLLPGCHQEKRTYLEHELLKLAVAVEPKIEIILPKDLESGVKCEDYGGKEAGCVNGKRAKLRKVVITLVQFQTEDQAKLIAEKIDQYYKFNWLFDDVRGEPVLEYFVQQAFGAERPAAKNPLEAKP